MNKVILIGNLTRDAELAETNGGIKVCQFTLAVQRPFTDTNGERATDFFNVKVWRGLAESCAKYLSKGKKAMVEGSLQNRKYTDSKGIEKQITEIMATNVEFLSAKTGQDGETEQKSFLDKGKRESPMRLLAEDQDLPF